MRLLECTECHKSVPAASGFLVNDRYLCEPCADRQVSEIQKAKGKLVVVRGKDPSICAKCSGDFGSQELPLLSGLNVCEPCRQQLLDFRYPLWLKNAAAVLLLLLAYSLFHGRSYFAAGHAYYKGKTLLDSGDALHAVPYFEDALHYVPESAQLKQNTALAYMRSGRIDNAFKVVEGQKFEQDDLYRALSTEVEHWNQATKYAEEAAKLYDEAKYKESAQRMHNAATIFPAFPGFESQAMQLDSSAAFFSRDYNAMLQISEIAWMKFQDYGTSTMVASAYSCLYADRGDPMDKEKAEAMMARSHSLAASKEDKEDLAEWVPRMEHRLRTRRILSREQFATLTPGEKAAEAVQR